MDQYRRPGATPVVGRRAYNPTRQRVQVRRRSFSGVSDNTTTSLEPVAGSQLGEPSSKSMTRLPTLTKRPARFNPLLWDSFHRKAAEEGALVPIGDRSPAPIRHHIADDDDDDDDDDDTVSQISDVSTATETTSTQMSEISSDTDSDFAMGSTSMDVKRNTQANSSTALQKRQPAGSVTAPSRATTQSSPNAKKALTIQITPARATPEEVRQLEKVTGALLEQIDQYKNDTQSLQRKKEHLTQELEDAGERLSALGLNRDDLERERNQERQAREQLVLEFNEQRMSCDQLVRECSEHRRSREQLIRELDDQQRALETFRASFEEQHRARESAETDRDNHLRLLDDFRSRFEMQCRTLQSAEKDRDHHRRLLDEFRTGFEKQGETLRATEFERDGLKQENRALETKCLRLDNDIRQLQTDLQFEKDVGKSLVSQVAALEMTTAAAEGRLEALKMDNSAQEKNIMELSAERESLRGKVEQDETRVRMLTEERAALEAQKAKLLAQLDAGDDERSALQARINDLEGDNHQLGNKMAVAEAEAGAFKAQADALGADKTTGLAKIGLLSTERDALQQNITTLELVHASQEAELSKLRTYTDSAAEQITKLHEENLTLRSADTSVALMDLRKTHDALQDQTKALVEHTQKLEAHTKELQEQAAQVPDLANQNMALGAELSGLKEKLVAVGAEASTLQTQLKEAQAQAQRPSRSSSRKKHGTRGRTSEEMVVIKMRNPKEEKSKVAMKLVSAAMRI